MSRIVTRILSQQTMHDQDVVTDSVYIQFAINGMQRTKLTSNLLTIDMLSTSYTVNRLIRISCLPKDVYDSSPSNPQSWLLFLSWCVSFKSRNIIKKLERQSVKRERTGINKITRTMNCVVFDRSNCCRHMERKKYKSIYTFHIYTGKLIE